MNMDKAKGFTLMELMIVIAIIGILVAIAIPSYRTYTRRAHYTEVVQAAAPYKIRVEECYQISGQLDSCVGGQNGVPPAVTKGNGVGLIESIEITDNGEIVVTPQAKYGIETKDTYILSPTPKEGKLIWTASGGGVSAGYAN